MVEVNLLGAITAAEVFLDQLKDGGGDIVNISRRAIHEILLRPAGQEL
jgi:NAD(P)-dependent dehydrogenase (short-subunit alcohol dehydrogenase family)